MPLETRMIEIPLTGMLNDKAGEVSTEAPQFAVLSDVRVDQIGQLDQRRAMITLPTNEEDEGGGVVITEPAHALFTNRDDLCLRTHGGQVWRYSTATDGWTKTPSIGSVSQQMWRIPCDATSTAVGQASKSAKYPALATCSNDFQIQGWVDNGVIRAQVVDPSGVVLLGPQALTYSGASGWEGLRAVASGTRAAFFALSSGGRLVGWSVVTDDASPSIGAGVSIATTVGRFDVDANPADSEYIIARANSGSGAVTLERVSHSTLASASTVVPATAAASYAIGIKVDPSENRLICMYAAAGGALYAVGYDDTLATAHFGHTLVEALTSGGTQAIAPVAAWYATNGEWRIYWMEAGASPVRHASMSTSGTPSHYADWYSCNIIGRPWSYTSEDDSETILLPLQSFGGGTNPINQHQIVVCDVVSYVPHPVARLSIDRFASTDADADHPMATGYGVSADGKTFSFLLAAASSPQTTETWRSKGTVMRFALTFPGESRRFAEYDGVTYFGGGTLFAYDGQRVHESTPSWFPRSITVASTPAGGSLSAGTYGWKAVYEWEDAAGVLHRSAPSRAVSDTAAASDYANIDVPKLSACSFIAGADTPKYRIALYRTTVNGSVYYLESSTSADELSAGATDNLLRIVSTAADADLGAILYTEGGIIEPIAPPAVRDLCIGKGRMFLASGDRRNEVWYSKPLERNTVPEFNTAQIIDIPDGPVEAVEVMDEKLIIFTDRSVWAVYGDGPNAAGQGAFSEPQLLTRETGCVSRNSVLSVSQGVWFHGSRGLMLVDRGLQVQFPGAAVQETISPGSSASLRVSSATQAKDAEELRFVVGDAVAVYNTVTGQWYTWSGIPAATHAVAWVDGDGTAQWTAIDADTYPGEIYTLDVGNSVYGEASGGADATVRTGHIRLSGTGGIQRVRRVVVTVKRTGTCGLVVKGAADYGGLTTIATIASANISSSTPQAFSIAVPTQKCATYQVEVTSDGVGSNTGKLTIYGIALEVGVKSGEAKVPASRKG